MMPQVSVQSPKAYDLQNLSASQLGTRLAAGANAALRGNIATALQDSGNRFQIDPRETTAGLIEANLTFGFDVGDVRRYGAVMDGSTDDFAALEVACSVLSPSGAVRVYIPEGDMALASANFPLVLPGNITMKGAGLTRTRLIVTGSDADNLMEATNVSNIEITDLTLRGNNTATGFSDGGALKIAMTGAAAAACRSFKLRNVRLENFNAWYWVYFSNQSDFRMRDIKVIDCEWQSETGNSLDPTSLAIPADCLVFQGQDDDVNGLITDVDVRGNWADCEHVKTFGVTWHGTARVRFRDNSVLNSGQTGAADDKAGYAFLCYDNSAGGAPPNYIEWVGNYMADPRSAGIYCAGVNNVRAAGNNINGQTDTVDATLPKAAIVFNAATKAEAVNNFIDNCFGGIVLNGNSTSDRHYAYGNRIINVRENGYGIVGENLSLSGKMLRMEIVANSIETSAAGTRGIYLRFDSTHGCTHLVIRNNPCVQGVYACLEVTSATSPDIQYADISDNGIVGNGSSNGIYWVTCQDAQTRVTFARNKFTGSWASGGFCFDVRDSYNMTIRDLEFDDFGGATTGFAMRTAGARGTIAGVRFNGVAAARRLDVGGTEDLGYDAPTWTGAQGDFVQNLVPIDTVGTTWDYVIDGWRYTAANWRAVYAPYQDA